MIVESNNMFKLIKKVVYGILKQEKVLQGEWTYGKVAEVIGNNKLKVFVSGSQIAQTVPCNPNVTFNVGDMVFVHKVNKSMIDLFVPYKSGA